MKTGFNVTEPRRSRHFLRREKCLFLILRAGEEKRNMISWCGLFQARVIPIRKNRLVLIFLSGLREMAAAAMKKAGEVEAVAELEFLDRLEVEAAVFQGWLFKTKRQ